MKHVDLSQVKMASSECKNKCSALSQNYKGVWDDPVHDSFMSYNKHINHSNECMR